MTLSEFKKLIEGKYITDITTIGYYLADESRLSDINIEKLYKLGLITRTDSRNINISDDTTKAPEVEVVDDTTKAPETKDKAPKTKVVDDTTKAPEVEVVDDIVVDDGSDE